MKIRIKDSVLNPNLTAVALAVPSAPNAGIMSGAGDDTYNVPGDVVVENPNEGTDLVISTITYTLGANVENLTLSGSGNIDGTGNELGNVITGNDGDNSLTGNDGNDTLAGGNGNDTLTGGAGDDSFDDIGGVNSISGGDGDDYITYNNLTHNGSTFDGGDGVDTFNAYLLVSTKTINLADGTYADDYGTETLISIENVIGAPQTDVITGSDAANMLNGLGGEDSLYGGGGNDTIYGGDNYDVIYGGDGVNELYGEGGDDYIQTQTSFYGSTYDGGDGSDMLDYSWIFGDYGIVIDLTVGTYTDGFGSETLLNFERVLGTQGSETLIGTTGANQIYGNAGNDSIVGFGGADTLNGGEGNDTVTALTDFDGEDSVDGGEGDDVITSSGYGTFLGGDGNDTVLANNGANETLDGGAGTDLLDTTSWDDGYSINLATGVTNYSPESFINFENAIMGDGNDTVTGTSGANDIDGGAGEDTLLGEDGNDTLHGGAGQDTLSGGGGNDELFGDSGNSSILGGSGNDTIHASTDWFNISFGQDGDDLIYGNFQIDQLDGGAGNDTMYGYDGGDSINGIDGNDAIYGGNGNDTLNGGLGTDTLVGGLDNDTYSVDNTGDVVTEANGQGTDTIFSTVTYSLSGRYIEFLTLTGAANINATGNSLAQTLTGNTGNNTLTGLGGNDRLDGGAGGADTLIGGAGDDTYVISTTGDTVTETIGEGWDLVESAITYTLGSEVERLTLTGSANINGTGNGLNNVLTGNAGNNTLAGGLGDDTYYVQNAADHVSESSNSGTDSVFSTVTYSLAGKQIENLTLTDAAVDATGNGLANTLVGNANANTLDGGAGHDSLNGSAGADTMIGGTGNDSYAVDDVGDVVTEAASSGGDVVNASVTCTLSAEVESLVLTGTAAINGTGNAGNNTLTGNSGNNVLSGGLGNDTYYVQNTGDNVVEAGGAGTDLIYSTVTYTLAGRFAETLTLTGTANINATGNSNSNTLIGNDGNNTLNGKGGPDKLTGGLGADIFLFEAGSAKDTIYDFSAAQNDTINVNAYTGGVANNSLVAQVGGNVVITFDASNTITVIGASQADVLAHMAW
ncbi:hemolysin-type calcium-binding repeat 2 copies family protein [Asticcacaulis biprosthecium C19]|uniref:Hemolysin-type calcium-binding repeat 2 copies family protein n=1 Tax=Asticcacaulis biprosthecium C19 TaxID=715226 RepID=F4QKA2_9CAUL|nr:calcium-binding protein [Asticcacaulis biprosthecium]EGF93280.1 hemolysin-type calcium-binding repeat 2 copies family protein [Asticcacaulis biprosthecium C19]